VEDFFYICIFHTTMENFLLFLNISGGEILLIVIVVYLVFGPKKIPEFARMIGKGINELRRATNDIKNEIKREANKVKDDIGIDMDDPLKTKSDSNEKTSKEPSKATKNEEKKEKPKDTSESSFK